MRELFLRFGDTRFEVSFFAPAAFGGLGFSVSPDDHYLLYSVADAPESDIMLVTFGDPKYVAATR